MLRLNRNDFFKEDGRRLFFDDPKAIAKYCLENCIDDVEHILRVADEVSRGYFIFDLKWDMERTYEPVIFDDVIDWNHMPKDDPEFIWQFNRHRFFICLGQAYQLTGDEKYAEAFVNMLTDWVKNVPKTEQFLKGPWRTLETGLRGEFWNKAMRYFKDSPKITDDFTELFTASMKEHAEHIMEHHYDYKYISNWGVLENHGLFEIAVMLPKSEDTQRYMSFALKNLEIQANMQVMDDGMHWEQSPMYHNEVLHCFLDVLILADRNGIRVSDIFRNKVHKMAEATAVFAKPDHHQPMNGDSDDTDIRDLLTVSAYVFKDPVLKGRGYEKPDFESIWDMGMEAMRDYEKMPIEEPSYTSAALSDSGNYYFRSGHEERANYLHFHCGTLGAGHGHSDKLHVDLVIKGEDVLMDSGRYTYVTGADRFYFKDPVSHNTITADGEYFTVNEDSWMCSRLAQPVKQQFVAGEKYDFVQGGHLGYSYKGIFMNRKIVHIKPDIYLIFDEMYAKDSHEYESHFNFSELGQLELTDRTAMFTVKDVCTKFSFLSEDSYAKIVPSKVSRHYNQFSDSSRIVLTKKAKGTATLVTAIVGGDKERVLNCSFRKIPVLSALKNITYSDDMAEAVSIQDGEKKYTVIVCHQEVNSPTDLVKADTCRGYGNVIVFDHDEETIGGKVLNW